MNNTIAIIKNAFDIGYCNNALSKMKNKQRGAVGAFQAGSVVEEARKSNVSFINGIINNSDLYTPLISKISEINTQYFGFDLNEPETIQLTEYDSIEQGEYKPHEDDASWIGLVPEQSHPFGVRKLSVIVQLTDPSSYEGGELIFPDTHGYDSSNTTGIGTCIMFPSYMKHGVTPVTSGVRHSLVSWILGPPFK